MTAITVPLLYVFVLMPIERFNAPVSTGANPFAALLTGDAPAAIADRKTFFCKRDGRILNILSTAAPPSILMSVFNSRSVGFEQP